MGAAAAALPAIASIAGPVVGGILSGSSEGREKYDFRNPLTGEQEALHRQLYLKE